MVTMSSGPSQECLNGRSSGTILLSIISMSSLTSGSQFSLMARDAEVWSSWMCISPTENCDSSGSCKYKSLCVLPWRWPVTTHPPEYLLRDEVDSPVLRSEVDLALQPGVGAHDEA